VSSRAGPALPVSTAASFKARLCASAMPVFMPNATRGGTACAASPVRNARLARKRSASRPRTRQGSVLSTSTSSPGSPTAARIRARQRSGVKSPDPYATWKIQVFDPSTVISMPGESGVVMSHATNEYPSVYALRSARNRMFILGPPSSPGPDVPMPSASRTPLRTPLAATR
jgi:hypothetical protein